MTEREFVCFNCGLYWSVLDTYDAEEPIDVCPQCGGVGAFNGTYRLFSHPKKGAKIKDDFHNEINDEKIVCNPQ